MAGKHRAPAPVRPKVPRFVTGAVAASALLTASGPVVMPMVAAEPLPVQETPAPLLPMPMWTPALAALYLPHLDPATTQVAVPHATPVVLAAETHPADAPHQTKQADPVTVKAAGVSGGLAARAVTAAVAQKGTPYVYGGSAPGGFDCSGLMMWAFAKAGISLPRTAAAQAQMGRAVSLSQVKAGDLLFYYSPIEHVVIANGDGTVTEASQPGVPVHVVPLYTSGLVSVRRIVG